MTRSGPENPKDRAPSPPVAVKEPLQEEPQERRNGERGPGTDKPQPRRPPVPHKPSRIPSTGNRATVMDVAQVWCQHEKQGSQDVATPRSVSPNSPSEFHPVQPGGIQTGLDHRGELEEKREREREEQESGGLSKADVKVAIGGCGIQTSASSAVDIPGILEKEGDAALRLPELLNPAEKSKLSWEKYSEFIMPPLEEERTPVPIPMPTLNKPPKVSAEPRVQLVVAPIPETRGLDESRVDYLPIDLLSTTLDPEGKMIKVAPTDLVTFGKRIRVAFPFKLMSRQRLPELCGSED
jgi:hypothetical protein